MACVLRSITGRGCLFQRRLAFVEITTTTSLLAFLRHPFQLRQYNAFHMINLQGAHYDRSRGDSERHHADRVKVKFKIARRQTMAEMRCRSGAVARPLAALSGSIGFHHRNLTRSARLGDSHNDS
jgi:hypothetical protein